ncbi:MAG: cytochrome c, partial [Myxococcales bacterium]|nr:cytochrome c [Myxococcales bacterium]
MLAGVEIPAETLNHGQRLYMRSCASCHAVDGSGRGPAARSLNPGPRDFRTGDFLYKSTPEGELPTDEDVAATIRNGRLERGMPAWRGMQETDITALVHFIKTFSPRWRDAAGDAGSPAPSTAP